MTSESRESTRTRVSRYTPSPHLPSESTNAYDVILRVMSGTMNVTAGALALAMPRNHFQTCLHKAQGALIEALPRGRTGRPKKSEALRVAETTIRAQTRALERSAQKTKQLEEQLAATSALIRSQMSLPRTTPPRRTSKKRSRRSHASRSRTSTTSSSTDSEDGPARTLEFVSRLEKVGIPRLDACVVAGVSPSTVRRWRAKGVPTTRRPARERPRCDAATTDAVRALVRKSKGCIGAVALSRSVGDVSRRDAAAIKACELSELERKRREDATRITICSPGVLRGFDAMHLWTHTARAYALRAQEGAVPFTTTVAVEWKYDGRSVCDVLERDFRNHGAPYVLRLDRASVHRTPDAKALCARAGVLVLHGPPRCARFYGQLERPHRDLRVFAPLDVRRDLDEHVSVLQAACVLLNRDWRRRSLEYQTAEKRWNARIIPALDRGLLCDEVLELTERIQRANDKLQRDECHRFAVVATMLQHKLLRQTPGGHC